MIRQLRIVRLALGVALIFAVSTARAAAQNGSPQPPRTAVAPPAQMSSDQMTNIPYFTLRDGMNSALTLNNTGLSPVPVTVTIYNMQGRSQVLPPITVDPHSFKQIDLREVVASEFFDSGNLQVSYQGIPMAVTCQLSVYSLDKRVSFESREQAMMDFESSTLNGILWLPAAQAEGFLALTNESANNVSVQLTVGSKNKDVSLYPHETHLVKLNEEHAPTAALIRLQHNGKPGDIVTTGFVLDLKNGYSATFMMHDPKLMRSSLLAGAHVRFGQPDAAEGFPDGTQFRAPLLLANVSDKPVNAHVSVDYTVSHQDKKDEDKEEADTNKAAKSKKPQPDAPADKVSNVAVKDLTVASGDVQKIELSEEMTRFIDGPVKEAGVEIAFDGAPGALIANLTSVDQTGDYAFEVPIKDPSAIGEWPQGVYPWTLEGSAATTLHLKNFTDKSQLAQLEIRFEGGTYNPKMLTLAPHQTMAVDIRKLKDSRTPDERGQVIPADVTHGQLWWGPITLRTIIGRNEEVNVTQGIARSFSCSDTCCGKRDVNFQMAPGSATMPVNGDARPFVSQWQQYTCIGGGSICSGGFCNPSYYSTNWYNYPGYWSSDSSVATIVGGSSYYGDNAEITTGSNGGTANIIGSFDWWYDIYSWDPDSRTYFCDANLRTGSASAPVQVLTLGRLQISLTSNPVSGQTNSVVSGQAATVSVTAYDQHGGLFTQYTGTVHFSSSDSFASLPADYTFTSSDAGSHTFNVTLKTVSGTSSTRNLTAADNSASISNTLNPYVWFQTTMDVEFWKNCGFTACTYAANGCPIPNGSYYCTTAYLGCTPNQPSGYSCQTSFMAITQRSSSLFNQSVTVAYNGSSRSTIVGDAGPSLNNPYWNTGTIPSMGGCLSDQLASNLGISSGCNPGPFGMATIYWRFGN